VLAGLIKSPNHYSPFKNAEGCLKRKNIVLSLLYQNGYITSAERELALQTPLPTAPSPQKNSDGFLCFVFDELEELSKDGSAESTLEAGKLLVKEILENTEDRTGLIKEIK
jgi:membrane peptidoglycan carboxypeptidase